MKRSHFDSVDNFNSQNKQKRIRLSIEEKLSILKSLENKDAPKDLAEKYNVSPTTISKIKKNKGKLSAYSTHTESTDGSLNRKSMKKVVDERLEQAIWMWFCQKRALGSPVSGPMIQEKAQIFCEMLQIGSNFKASNGWLEKFKLRHGIRQLDICGEKLSADESAAEAFVKTFKELFEKHKGKLKRGNFWNCDESGLMWKALPSKTLASKRESSCPGPKMRKDRVSILFCANADGSCRMPLLVIGKSKTPRWMKNLKSVLPVLYRNQKSAWMDSAIFKKWFFEEWVPTAKRHNKENNLPDYGILILDNAPSHPDETILTTPDGRYKAIFLPPNVTSILQPLDQSVIETFKRYYRKYFLRKFLILDHDEPEKVVNFWKDFKLNEGILLAADAWQSVKTETLQRSWNKLWPLESEIPEPPSDNLSASTFVDMLKNIGGCEDCDIDDVNLWLREDAEDPGFEVLDEDAIVRRVNKEDIEEETAENEASSTPSNEEILQSLDQVLDWAKGQEGVSSVQIDSLSSLRDLLNQNIIEG